MNRKTYDKRELFSQHHPAIAITAATVYDESDVFAIRAIGATR